ncbi:MAG: GspH/FimT family pseudopilin [Candidatus Eutrophobiaceae bacterium]
MSNKIFPQMIRPLQAVRCAGGFTLIEAMIVVALMGVILSFALPNYQNLVRDNCLSTVTNELVADMQFARSEAIKRRENVRILSTDWSEGWQMEASSVAGNMRVSTPSCQLRIQNPVGKLTFTSRGFSNGRYEFLICDPLANPRPDAGRVLSVSYTGRAKVKHLLNGSVRCQ